MDISGETRFSNVPQIFGTAVASGAERPILTFYDDATGERTELSGTTLANWVAKTANMLVDGLGLGPGDTAAIMLPPHWQTAAVLLGAWSAGLDVTMIDARFADLPSSAEAMARPVDVTFTTSRLLYDKPPAADRFVLGLAPMAMPLRDVPDGFVDYVAEVRQYGDHFTPTAPATESQLETVRLAAAWAQSVEIRAGDRVLIDASELLYPFQWLLAPMTVGASIVLCANLDKHAVPARVEAERVTLVLPR